MFAAIPASGVEQAADSAAPVRFREHILPLLSDRCFHCHGPDEKGRKAELRLDSLEEASRDLGGRRAIAPGKPGESALLERILSSDPEEVMPPPKTHKKIKPEDAALLRRWIAEGARYEKHWSFEPVVRPRVPILEGAPGGWVRNPIDAFVAEKLRTQGIKPSPEAPAHVLMRRASLDLTGLPPEPAQVENITRALAGDEKSAERETAWQRFVEEKLASPHHGERLAMFWLDAARYSDTDGYQADSTRTNWPWRDWVVNAFNSNQPYDAFTLEQFAGDLLPGATSEQKLATCFHRNHMANGEGGRLAEESRVDYVIDRVNTTGTVWLGLTMGCAQCHSHKFDPVTQADYYKLSAFFNSIDETGAAGSGAKPFLEYKSPHGQRAITEAQQLVEARKAKEAAARADAIPAFEAWIQSQRTSLPPDYSAWRPLQASTLETNEGTTLTQDSASIVLATGKAPVQDDYRVIGNPGLQRISGFKLEVLPDASLPAGGPARSDSGHFILTDVKAQVRVKGASQTREIAIVAAKADHSPDSKKNGGYGNIGNTFDDDPRNGWANFDADPSTPHTAVWAFAEPESLAPHEELIIELRQRALRPRHTLARFRILITDQPGPAPRSLDAAPLEQLARWTPGENETLPPALRGQLLDQFLVDHAPYRPLKEQLDLANAHLAEMKSAASKLNVTVLQERAQPRETHVLIRGQWDKPGDPVERGVPEAIAPWNPQQGTDSPRSTRADLARWLTAPQNPLTPRVTVNHLWQMLFGEGLVRTPDDFGLQGESPTHPELLDWLAAEFIESGWNIRHVLKLIATSATYRQSSRVSAEMLAADPANRLLARGSRFRMPAWMLRDQALAVSGLLNPVLGGPPVRPYQPAGVWEDITMGRFKYTPSDGPDQYRRTLYAFWRRSAAPSFLFDSAQRRVCEVRTARTNTPLHALTLMNDLTFLEASRHLAVRALQAAPEAPVSALFERVLLRKPESDERQSLQKTHATALAWYRQHPGEAHKALAHGQSETPVEDATQTAALMLVANLILNLDEALTRE
jgi:mono/diheme cytochrome c family protein